MEIKLVIAPNGVAIPQEQQDSVPSPKLLWTLAPVAAALVRPMLQDPQQTADVTTNLVRADESACVWQVGPWIIHGSDLRAGTLAQFQELVKTARARAAISGMLGAPSPLYVMSGVGADEGIPVGFIVQIAAAEVPLPMVSFPLPRDVQSMWLVAKRLDLAARLGEVTLQQALADVVVTRGAHGELSTAFDPMMKLLAEKHGIVGDEAVATMILEGWMRDGGGAKALEDFAKALVPVGQPPPASG